MGAYGVTIYLDSAGWQDSDFRITLTTGCNCTHNGTIRHYAAYAGGTVKASISKKFTNDECPSLL
jgi:hypothetical protein